MPKPKRWKMLFGVENEYQDGSLHYGQNLAYDIPRVIVASARQLRGLPERAGDFFAGWMADKAVASVGNTKLDLDNRVKRIDALRMLGFSGIRLPNRMRVYVDMGHPEISTAECTTPKEILLQQKASERIIETLRRKATEELGLTDDPIVICKNNSSVRKRGKKRTSWATHENYLIPPDLFDEIVRGRHHGYSPRKALWIAFLVSRIYGGSGKTGSDLTDSQWPCRYQLFQRSDFISELQSIGTTEKRGLINTRDIPYADHKKYRRLHVICGDALIAPWSIYVTYGATALFLKMLAENFPMHAIAIRNPVEAFHAVSRDITGKKRVIEIVGSSEKLSSLEIQKRLLGEMERYISESGSIVFSDVVEKLRFILRLFEDDPEQLKFYLDFAIKRHYLFIRREEKPMSGRALKLAELDYHDMNPETGSYFAIEEEGFPEGSIAGIGTSLGIVTSEEIEWAMHNSPTTSRAYFGGEIVRRFPEEIESMSWGVLETKAGSDRYRNQIFRYDPWFGTKDEIGELLEESSSLAKLLKKSSALL